MTLWRRSMLWLLLLVLGAATVAIVDGRYRAEQIEAFKAKFQLLASLRRSALETYFDTARAEVAFWTQSAPIRQSMSELTQGWQALDAAPGEQVRKLYISANKPADGGLGALDDAGDGSAYSRAHAGLHALAREFVTARGYYDFFLIDMQGNVIYTVEKEDDFASNLVDGPYADSGLGQVFATVRAVAELPGDEPAKVVLSDFERYAPSQGAPAIFAGKLIRDDRGQALGVLVLQLPTDTIRDIMRFTNGMGESGETYLVGEDRMMRSDSRFSAVPTVLDVKVDTPTVSRALDGVQGTDFVADYRGIRVLSAYDYIDFSGVRWAVMAEIDEAEVEATINSIWGPLSLAMLAIIALLAGTVTVLRDAELLGAEASAPDGGQDSGAAT